MGKRLDDGVTCLGKGAMGRGGLQAPSELRPTRQWDLGPYPTKGLSSSLLEADVGTNDGV